VLLLNLFVIVLAGVSVFHGYRQYQERAEITTQNLAQVLESKFSDSFQRIDIALLSVLDDYEQQRAIRGKATNALDTYIDRVRLRLPEANALRITDAKGLLIYGTDVNPAAKVSLADRPHFVRLRDDPQAGLVISKPQISRVGKQWVMVLARRVTQPDGSFGGMIFATISLEHIYRLFSSLNLGPRGLVALRDSEMGLIVRYPEPERVGLTVGSANVAPELQQLLQAGQTSGTFNTSRSADNLSRTITFRKLGEYPLYIVVGLSTSDNLAAWRDDTGKLVAMVALFMLSTLSASWLLYRAWKRKLEANENLAWQETVYRELVENTSMLVARYLPDTTLLFANAMFANFFGHTPEELAGKRWIDFIPREEDRSAVLARIASLTPDSPCSSLAEHQLSDKAGQIRWTHWTDCAFFSDQGELTHLQSVGNDITARKRAEEALLQQKKYLRAIFETEPECVKVVAPNGYLEDMNPAGLRMLEVDNLEEAQKYGLLEFVDPAYRQAFIKLHKSVCAGNSGILEFPIKGKKGTIRWLETHATPLRGEKGTTISLLGITRDITEHKLFRQELEQQARIDYLTGVNNRGYFMQLADLELARAKRYGGSLSIFMMDIDFFKKVNDSHGHKVGDIVLKKLTEVCRESLREVDIIGRIGGEEFAILLPETEQDEAVEVAERLRAAIASAKVPLESGLPLHFNVSIGVASLVTRDDNMDVLLNQADRALYEAKNSGRNRVCLAIKHHGSADHVRAS